MGFDRFKYLKRYYFIELSSRLKLDKIIQIKKIEVNNEILSTNLLEDMIIINKNLDNGSNYKKEKRKFFEIVDFIKIHEIKSENVLTEVNNIRKRMIMMWRPTQYTIRSGVLLWTSLVLLGSLFIYFSMLIPVVLKNLGAWMVIINIITLVFGWLAINIGIHNLGHFIAGEITGIRFQSWVIRSSVFQWALIINYKSYLKASFRKRQILHMSGPLCTLGAPWMIYIITLNPIMIGIGIYMFVASIPVMVMKKWDYGRYLKERKLNKQSKTLKS